jgi:hypothetical protein
MTNPTDAAIERHIWPDGDWHHETCRCGAAHPRDAGILARSTSTALEELDFHNRRANAAIARAAAAERVVDALQDDDMLGVLAEAMHSGYRHAIDGPEAMPIHRLITQMDGDEWGRYVYYVGSHLREWIDARTHQPTAPRDTPSATDDLIDRFAAVLKAKASAAETKYGWNDGWLNPDAVDDMRASLYRHLAKGDPRDVAIYCAFLWHHEATIPRDTPPGAGNQEGQV